MNEINKKIEGLIDQQSMHGNSPDLAEYDDREQLQFELQLQKKIDAALGRNFHSEPVVELEHRKKMEALISNSEKTSVSRSNSPDRRTMAVRALVLAASVLLLVGLAWQFYGGSSPDIDFTRRPLAMLYQKTVDRGFKPYYDCREPARFAAEFDKRLGVPLRLAEMPKHKKMTGIALVGGITRNTTSMLALVNNEPDDGRVGPIDIGSDIGEAGWQPVLVFVDRLSEDDEEMRAQVGTTDGYNIFRTAKHGLVFYEVSKFEDAQLIEYFERIDR